MSRDDIQKLLGGYATGTLTPEEQRTLYEAALTDQELFDALAREEALRDVLSDPSARAQLLAAIDDVPVPWYRRWWRPMVVMATAALLVAGVAVYTRPPKPPHLAKVELPRFRPPVAEQSPPLLPPAPELRRAEPALQDLAIPLPQAKPAPPPPPVFAAAPAAAPQPVQRDAALTQGATPTGPRQQTQGQFAPAIGNGLLQPRTVQLNGSVTDPTGEKVPAANVEVKSLATGETFKTSTDAKGEFNAPAAPGKAYEVSASAPGFRATKLDQVTPVNGSPEPVNLKLDIGSAAETVDVTASAATVPAAPRAATGRAGAMSGAMAEMKKEKAVAPAPALPYQLLRKLLGRNRSEVRANDTLPAGAALILAVTPVADGYLRIADGGRTIANPRVRRGARSDIELGTFDKPGRVELQVYFSPQRADEKDQAAPAFTIGFNIQ